MVDVTGTVQYVAGGTIVHVAEGVTVASDRFPVPLELPGAFWNSYMFMLTGESG
jgi:hypothetical protein